MGIREKLIDTISKTVDEYQFLDSNIIADGILNDIPEIRNLTKIAEGIKGIEVNNDFYQEFIKRHVRVNEGIPIDEVRVYYNDGYMRVFKIK